MPYDAASHRYLPISWEDAFEPVGIALGGLGSPHQAAFYTSGRLSNEATFLYQLCGCGSWSPPDEGLLWGALRRDAQGHRRFPPFCWTRARHKDPRASTVPQVSASPANTGSSPTAVISSSARGRAPGSAAKNRTAPGGGSAKFSQPKVLNARTYPAPGAAPRDRRPAVDLRLAETVCRVDHDLARQHRAERRHHLSDRPARHRQHDHVSASDRVADRQDRGTAWSRARFCPGTVHHLVAGRAPSLAERAADVAGPDDCDLHAGLHSRRGVARMRSGCHAGRVHRTSWFRL